MAFYSRLSSSTDSLKKAVDNTLLWDTSSSTTSTIVRRWHMITTHLLVCLLTALACWIFVVSTAQDNFPRPRTTKTLTCGNSTTEAKALGCEFDPLTVAWIPAPCINHEITQLFMADSPWVAYSDKTSSEVINREQMAE